MEDHSKQRNKPSTQAGYQKCINRNIIPLPGRMKVQDVKRPDAAGAMKKMAHKPADANRTFSVMRKMFNLAKVWGYRPDGTNPCRHVPMCPNGKATWLDQQLLSGGRELGDLGFGGEVKNTLKQRADFLEAQGLAQRRDQRVILARNLLGTLRNRELSSCHKHTCRLASASSRLNPLRCIVS